MLITASSLANTVTGGWPPARGRREWKRTLSRETRYQFLRNIRQAADESRLAVVCPCSIDSWLCEVSSSRVTTRYDLVENYHFPVWRYQKSSSSRRSVIQTRILFITRWVLAIYLNFKIVPIAICSSSATAIIIIQNDSMFIHLFIPFFGRIFEISITLYCLYFCRPWCSAIFFLDFPSRWSMKNYIFGCLPLPFVESILMKYFKPMSNVSREILFSCRWLSI